MLGPGGSPMANISIEFAPYPSSDIQPNSTIPCGVTDDAGRFVVVNGHGEGIPPRQYKVTANSLLPANESAVPERYRRPSTSPWLVTIPRKGKTDLVLQIE